jgi:hypothetical protein
MMGGREKSREKQDMFDEDFDGDMEEAKTDERDECKIEYIK